MDKVEPFANWDKPSWDDWFMAQAMLVAQRSIDPSTKHGCVIVNEHKQILSVGYNSPPPGCIDSAIPLTRPEKYKYFEHSESNAINNKNCSLEGATVYVTGHPCSSCFRKLLCNRVKEVVYGPIGSNCVDEEDINAIHLMNVRPVLPFMKSMDKIVLREYEGNLYEGNFCDVLARTLNYVRIKCETIPDQE